MDKSLCTDFADIANEKGVTPECVSNIAMLTKSSKTPEQELSALKNRRARIVASLNGSEPDQKTWGEMREINERVATLEKMLGADSPSEKSDVEHPSYYTSGGIECIDAMKAMLAGYEQAKIVTKFYWHFLSGQVLKYLWRWPLKERPLQDLKKARWYLDRLIDDIEKQDHAVTELNSDMGKGFSE